MLRTSNVPLLLALRRRGRATVLCFAVLVLITFSYSHSRPLSNSYRSSFFEGSSGPPSKYLSVVTPWTRPSINAGNADSQTQLRPGVVMIDEIDAIPPTLRHKEDASDGRDAALFGTDARLLPDHRWQKDGLLEVNPDGPHPIYELVRRAESKWHEKQSKASATLEQAVNEYKRRYKRSPPKGFDHWWDYVVKHDVQLPDEYDQIYRDLEPYWGIDPIDLKAAQSVREGIPDSYTLGKHTETDFITVVNVTVKEGHDDKIKGYMSWGAKPQMDLLREVHQFIPPFRATFSPEDGPAELVDWTWRNAAVEAAKKGTYLKPEDLSPQEKSGWAGACPPDSPLYLNPPKAHADAIPQTSKTFIHDHRASMDPCYHPQHLQLQGTFLSHGVGTKPQRFPAPLLSNSATMLHGDIHATSMAQSSGFLVDDPRWEDKMDDRLFWRGSATGMYHRTGINWRASQRVRLVNLTSTRQRQMEDRDGDGVSDFTHPYVSFLNPEVGPGTPVGEPKRYVRPHVNSALMDVKFSGPVGGCDPSGPVCSMMSSELSWGPPITSGPQGAGHYKYLLDVDGNGWSSRFRRLMSAHALVFKATVFPEWWTDRAQAWVHYVPVQLDYSDLYDSLVFFGGDLSGGGAHEEMAKKIASAGRQWTKNFWREQDVTAYMFRLWLEYARVMSVDRDEMSFDLPSNIKNFRNAL